MIKKPFPCFFSDSCIGNDTVVSRTDIANVVTVVALLYGKKRTKNNNNNERNARKKIRIGFHLFGWRHMDFFDLI